MEAAAPHEVSPLAATGAEMRRYAEAGHFPLMAAAVAEQRHALSTAAGLQTFGVLALMFFASAYSGWRGFSSSRTRGWSNVFWVTSVVALCLAPSFVSGLSPQLLDYLITASEADKAAILPPPFSEIYGPKGLNSRMGPLAFLIERGIAGAALAAFFAVLAHDLGYRLREALEDFELIEADEERHRRAPAGARRSAGQARHRVETPGAGEGGGFGQRSAPPPAAAPMSEDARARMVLGVSASASKREIERAYRAQMKRAHPDHGGSVQRAAALNAARDVLLRRG